MSDDINDDENKISELVIVTLIIISSGSVLFYLCSHATASTFMTH